MLDLLADDGQHVAVDDCIAEADVVTRDVAKAPNRLLLHLDVCLLAHNGDQDGDSLILNQFQHELGIAGRDICQAPDGLELKFRGFVALTELEQTGHKVVVDGLLDGWVLLEGEELAQANSGQDLDNEHV